MPQGKAVDWQERELVIRWKEHFDQERYQGSSVSTKDPADRVAKALRIGKRTVKETLETRHKTGQVVAPWKPKENRPTVSHLPSRP